MPGIGKVYGERLKAEGFITAQSVIDQYLKLEKNEAMFKTWLKDTCSANTHSQNECYFALRDWCLHGGPYQPTRLYVA